MRKTLLFSLLPVFLLVATYAAAPAHPHTRQAVSNRITTGFNVRIKLVDIHGAPYTGSTGLRGYWAQNQQTGQYYYPGGQDDFDNFENLPAGTYLFGAYNGVWDGATTEMATVDADAVGEDGFIDVELTYWVE